MVQRKSFSFYQVILDHEKELSLFFMSLMMCKGRIWSLKNSNQILAVKCQCVRIWHLTSWFGGVLLEFVFNMLVSVVLN